MIPTEALIPELQGQKVYLLKGGKAIPSTVKTGIRMSRQIQVTEGVSDQDSIIVTGLLQVKDSRRRKSARRQNHAKPINRWQRRNKYHLVNSQWS
jgi:hypothetical protein